LQVVEKVITKCREIEEADLVTGVAAEIEVIDAVVAVVETGAEVAVETEEAAEVVDADNIFESF
jgi:hypothetical protein